MEPTHVLKRDGRTIAEGTKDSLFSFLLDHQSQSVSWALAHEGYSIEPIDPNPDAEPRPKGVTS